MMKPVEIKNKEGLTLRGTMHVPDNTKSKMPAVAIYHGFTGQKAESHFIFVKLSRELEKVGIASVRFDFAGSGESDGEFIDMTVSGEISDAECILDYLGSLEFVDKERIGIVGLSLGGAVASDVAGLKKDMVRALALWAPAGNILREMLNDEEMKKSMNESGHVDVGGLLVGNTLADDIMKVNIYKDASQYEGPVLIVHGSSDNSVPLHVSSEDYRKIYGDRMTLHIIDGADHTFNKWEWTTEAVDTTGKFLKKNLT